MKRNFRALVYAGSAFGAVLVAGYVILGSGEMGQAARSLDSEREKARLEGLPLTVEEARQQFGNGDQVCHIYTELLDQETSLRKPPTSNEQRMNPEPMRYLDSGLFFEEIEQAKAALDQRSDYFKVVATLEQQAPASFPLHWKPEKESYFELQSAKNISRWLVLKAEMAIREGRYEDALPNYRLAEKIARDVAKYPDLLGPTMEAVIYNTVFDSIDRVVKERPSDPDALRVLHEAMAVEYRPMELSESVGGELVHALRQLDELRNFGPLTKADKVNFLYPDQLKKQPLRRSALTYQAYEARIIEMCRALKLALAGRAPLEGILAIRKVCSTRSSPSYAAANLWLKDHFEHAEATLGIMQARQLMIREEIAIFQARAKTRRFPDELPIKLLDPFSHRPLGYRRTNDGFVIWSVGGSLKDDGGKGMQSGFRGSPDVVIAFPGQTWFNHLHPLR